MLAFAHIPKTAGTTLTAVLRRNFGLRHFDTRGVVGKGLMHGDELCGVQRLYPKLVSIAGHGVSPSGDLHEVRDDIRYYTFVRDPIQRCLSHYEFALSCMAKRNASPDDPVAYFYQWINDHQDWHARQIAGEADAQKAIVLLKQRVSFIGLVERFDESLVMFREWTGLASLDIHYRSLNVSSDPRRTNIIRMRQLLDVDHDLAAAVADANREDAKIYRWVIENVYPEHQREYGPRLANDLKAFQEANSTARCRTSDSMAAKAYRNVVFKPLRRFVLPKRAA